MFDKIVITNDNIYINGKKTKNDIKYGYDFYKQIEILKHKRLQTVRKYDEMIQKLINNQNLSKHQIDKVTNDIYDIENNIMNCISEYEQINKIAFELYEETLNNIKTINKQINDIESKQHQYNIKRDDIKTICKLKKQLSKYNDTIHSISFSTYITKDSISYNGNKQIMTNLFDIKENIKKEIRRNRVIDKT